MQNSRPSKSGAIFRLIGLATLAFVIGATLLFQFYEGVLSGQLQVPSKFRFAPAIIVSPVHGTAIYYGLLFVYAVVGAILIAMPFAFAWRFWNASGIQRGILLGSLLPQKGRGRRDLGRDLLLFVLVPLVIFGFIFVAMMVGKR